MAWGGRDGQPAQRRSSLDTITPKAPITIGLPMALTNQGWERTCSSITSDAAAGHNWRCVCTRPAPSARDSARAARAGFVNRPSPPRPCNAPNKLLNYPCCLPVEHFLHSDQDEARTRLGNNHVPTHSQTGGQSHGGAKNPREWGHLSPPRNAAPKDTPRPKR